MKKPLILFIDCFCGAGGVTAGAVRARIGLNCPVKVIACVNHDPIAIESHEVNHKNTLHFNEDIRSEKVIHQIDRLTEFYKEKYQDNYEVITVLWASMECTNYSKAKGGMPRDADSRTLPEAMYDYIDQINPDYFYFENVVEFMAWGPLDENGRPVSMKKGEDYLKWVKKICSKGYSYDKTILNSADFGEYTKRKRLFGIFSNGKFGIEWPSPTHAENPKENGLFETLNPWKPVREVLDFEDEGKSVFERKKALVDPSLVRIIAGILKYVATGEGLFTTYKEPNKVRYAFNYKYYGSGSNVESVNKPAGTVRTKDGFALVQGAFLDKGFSGVHNHQSVNTPAGSIPTKDHYSVVRSAFVDKQYSGPLNHESINVPAGSLLSNPKQQIVQVHHFMAKQFGSGGQLASVNNPNGSLLAVPKENLVSVKAAHLMNPQYSSKGGSVNDPCFTLIARMDKAPPYLNQVNYGKHTPKIKPGDSETMRKLKAICWHYGIADITTRMLKVSELKQIQGFGKEYYLAGTKTDQKKFIGNAVTPKIVKAMMEALYHEVERELEQKVAA
jgi:DNA (cytosine-5)-methyltransferase 1